MKYNVLCVSAGVNVTYVGCYDVEVKDNKINKIRIYDFKKLIGKTTNEIAEDIYKNKRSTSSIIIDCRGFGVAIADELSKGSFICKNIVKSYTSQQDNWALFELKNLIDDKCVVATYGMYVDFSKYELELTTNNGIIKGKLKDGVFKEEFSNLALLISSFNNIDSYKKRTIIENNLTEILNILISDLNEMDVSVPSEVNELVRLIDKVNYIRGQY